MANVRKSIDGRKRARTMEYIDDKVDINDEEITESNIHIGQHIHAQFDLAMSITDKSVDRTSSKFKKRDSELSFLQRQRSDMSLNRSINESNKTTTGLKGREHVLKVMKTTTSKPVIDIKNHKLIQEMIAKRQERQDINKPISDFALKYGLIDNHGKKLKSRKTSDFM